MRLVAFRCGMKVVYGRGKESQQAPNRPNDNVGEEAEPTSFLQVSHQTPSSHADQNAPHESHGSPLSPTGYFGTAPERGIEV